MNKPDVLSDREIGDLLDLNNEYQYPCSDGSEIFTVDCRPVAQAQYDALVAYYEPRIELLNSMLADKDVAITDLKSLLDMAKQAKESVAEEIFNRWQGELEALWERIYKDFVNT